MCMIDDADRFECSSITTSKARKTHICTECGRTIHPKETYERFTGLLDNKFHTFKTCSHCFAARQWLVKHCGGFVFGFVEEELREHFDEGYKVDRVDRLVVGIKRQWRTIHKNLMPIPNYGEENANSTNL